MGPPLFLALDRQRPLHSGSRRRHSERTACEAVEAYPASVLISVPTTCRSGTAALMHALHFLAHPLFTVLQLLGAETHVGGESASGRGLLLAIDDLPVALSGVISLPDELRVHAVLRGNGRSRRCTDRCRGCSDSRPRCCGGCECTSRCSRCDRGRGSCCVGSRRVARARGRKHRKHKEGDGGFHICGSLE